MRILLACAAYPPAGKGGGPAASESIARALSALGHSVHVVTVADEDTRESRDGIEIQTLPSLNVYWNYWNSNPAYKKLAWHALENGNPRAFLRMRREIARVQPDVVMTISCENINVATWLAARALGVPTAHVVQSHFLLCWRGTMFRGDKNCARQCLECRSTSVGKRLLSQLVDGVVAESRHMLDRHAEAGYFIRARQQVIPAAIDWPVRSEPRMQTEGVRIGYIGMVTPNKGVETLARAAAHLGEAVPFDYLIAGDGPAAYAKKLSAIFPQGRSRFLGWSDPADFYPAIDVLVVPSLWDEPFGRVCIEAFAHGIPVVAARSGALPEIVEVDKSGLTFAPGDDRGLADCLRKLAQDRDTLARLQAGAAERCRHYSPERLGLAFEKFLGGISRRSTASPEPQGDDRFTRSGQPANTDGPFL
jgi:glycosyltransferase involved in cell wall biosynthesis